MVNSLGHHLNKHVLVSIPSVFGSTELHHCRLVGTETAGVWLESDDFTRIIGMGADPLPALIFVPFAQIACLAADPAARAELPREETKPPIGETRQKTATQTRTARARGKQDQ